MHVSIIQPKNFSAEPHAPAISKWNGNIHNQIDIDSIYELLGNKKKLTASSKIWKPPSPNGRSEQES